MIKFNAFRQRVLPLNVHQIRRPRAVSVEQWQFPHGSMLHHFDDAPIHATAPYLLGEAAVTIYPVVEMEMTYLKGRPVTSALAAKVEGYLRTLEKPLMRGRNLKRDTVSLSTLPVRDYHFLHDAVIYAVSDDKDGPVKAQYGSAMNSVDTLIKSLLRDSEAEYDTVILPCPVNSFKATYLRRFRESLPFTEMKAWTDKSQLFVREIFNAISDPDHALYQLKRPLILSLIKDGFLFSLDVKQMLEWSQGKEAETEVAFSLFVGRTQDSSAGKLGEDEIAELEAYEETPEALETIDTTTEHGEEVVQKAVRMDDATDPGIVKAVRAQQVSKGLSTAEAKRLQRLSERYKTIQMPGEDRTVVEAIAASKKEIKGRLYEGTLAKRDAIRDESMYSAATLEKNRRYVEKGVMEADMAAAALSLSKMGYMVQDYSYEDKGDALNHFREYTIKVTPVDGQPTTIKFPIPKVTPEGSFTANGVRYRMVPQKVDLPIRKVGPDRVALTSEYGKVSVTRSSYASYNLESWWSKKIMGAMTDPDDNRITNIRMTAGVHEKLPMSRTVSAIAQTAASFTARKVKFVFTSKQAIDLVGEEKYKAALDRGLTIIGATNEKRYALNRHGELVVSDGNSSENLGPFAEWIDSTWTNTPLEFANINVRGKLVPVALYLGYVIAMSHDIKEVGRNFKVSGGAQGLQALLDILGVKHRWAAKGSRAEKGEAIVRFDTETLFYDAKNVVASLVLSGMGRLDKALRYLAPSDLNAGGSYIELLDFLGHPARLATVIGVMQDAFIDPITEELLQDLGEPDEMVPLVLRAVEMLSDDDHQDETDRQFMRDRGYERISGFVYRELVDAVLQHRSSPYPSRGGINFKPRNVWNNLIADQSIRLVEESNPVHNMKEMDSLTYTGQGGRSGRTMTESTRRFLPNDIGAMSEAVPDSAKVGVNAYAPQGALYNSLRGTVDKFDPSQHGANNVVSCSSMLLPGSAHMDPKRNNLAGIQLSSMVSCVGGTLLPVRTGYEMTVLERTDGTFGVAARKPGKVDKVEEDGIKVIYDDGEEATYRLGLLHGTAAGATLPHDLTTDLVAGHKFKVGDAITWCSNHFSRDVLNPGGVSMKCGYLATVLFKDDADTLEDSSTISTTCSRKMSTPVTKKITVLVQFADELRDVVKLGTHVDAETPLMVIEDSVVAGLASTDDALQGIDKLAAKFPRAGEDGIVSRIEVLYQGNPDNMTASLQELVKTDNKRRKRESRLAGANPSPTGEIAETAFYNKEKITPNTAAITFYIDHYIDAEIGDKGVIDNPLKSIFGSVHPDTNVTESGRPIDIKFAFQSVDNRIIYSAIRYGILNAYLDKATDLIVEAYNS